MKLYATITSERASKGQGGNDKLEIKLQVGSAKNSRYIGVIQMLVDKNNTANKYFLYWYGTNESAHKDLLLSEGIIDNTKANKQKGE